MINHDYYDPLDIDMHCEGLKHACGITGYYDYSSSSRSSRPLTDADKANKDIFKQWWEHHIAYDVEGEGRPAKTIRGFLEEYVPSDGTSPPGRPGLVKDLEEIMEQPSFQHCGTKAYVHDLCRRMLTPPDGYMDTRNEVKRHESSLAYTDCGSFTYQLDLLRQVQDGFDEEHHIAFRSIQTEEKFAGPIIVGRETLPDIVGSYPGKPSPTPGSEEGWGQCALTVQARKMLDPVKYELKESLEEVGAIAQVVKDAMNLFYSSSNSVVYVVGVYTESHSIRIYCFGRSGCVSCAFSYKGNGTEILREFLWKLTHPRPKVPHTVVRWGETTRVPTIVQLEQMRAKILRWMPDFKFDASACRWVRIRVKENLSLAGAIEASPDDDVPCVEELPPEEGAADKAIASACLDVYGFTFGAPLRKSPKLVSPATLVTRVMVPIKGKWQVVAGPIEDEYVLFEADSMPVFDMEYNEKGSYVPEKNTKTEYAGFFEQEMPYYSEDEMDPPGLCDYTVSDDELFRACGDDLKKLRDAGEIGSEYDAYIIEDEESDEESDVQYDPENEENDDESDGQYDSEDEESDDESDSLEVENMPATSTSRGTKRELSIEEGLPSGKRSRYI